MPVIEAKIPEYLNDEDNKVNLNDDIKIEVGSDYYKSPDEMMYSAIFIYDKKKVSIKSF